MSTFEQQDLHIHLASSEASLDDLDFGVVGLDGDLACTHYNQAESRFSGLSPESVLGRRFFSEVAPCMNNFMVSDRLASEEAVDEIIDYILSVRMAPTPVRLRMIVRPSESTRFLLVEFGTAS